VISAFWELSCGRSAPIPESQPARIASNTAAPEVRTKAAPPPGDTRPVLITFGDSLTAGVAGKSYPEYLQDLIDAHELRYRVENLGVSGDTSTDGLARIENVLSEHPALVVLEFGGNDGLRGIPIEETRKNLEEMIKRIKAAGIRLVLLGITLPPNYGPDYVKPFTAMFPALAKQHHLPFLPFLLQHVYQHADMMQPDGIHPNGNGNRIVAQDVYDLVAPVLKNSTRGSA